MLTMLAFEPAPAEDPASETGVSPEMEEALSGFDDPPSQDEKPGELEEAPRAAPKRSDELEEVLEGFEEQTPAASPKPSGELEEVLEGFEEETPTGPDQGGPGRDWKHPFPWLEASGKFHSGRGVQFRSRGPERQGN